jgi:hypothetical protein
VCIIRFIAYDLVVIVAGRKCEHCGCNEEQRGQFFDVFVHNFDVYKIAIDIYKLDKRLDDESMGCYFKLYIVSSR